MVATTLAERKVPEMKNVHKGKGDINVSGGMGGELIGVAAVGIVGYFLLSALVHLLIILAIVIGALSLWIGAGFLAWRFYFEPRIECRKRHGWLHEPIDKRALYGDVEAEHEYPPAIENTNIILTPEQYERLLRRRDEN